SSGCRTARSSCGDSPSIRRATRPATRRRSCRAPHGPRRHRFGARADEPRMEVERRPCSRAAAVGTAARAPRVPVHTQFPPVFILILGYRVRRLAHAFGLSRGPPVLQNYLPILIFIVMALGLGI